MNQLGITYDPASGAHLSRRSDPETSHESAAEVVESGQLQGELERIAAGLSRRPGLTSRELASAINEDRHIVAKRMSVLKARGVAKDGEPRECSESGKRAITWWPVEGGVQ